MRTFTPPQGPDQIPGQVPPFRRRSAPGLAPPRRADSRQPSWWNPAPATRGGQYLQLFRNAPTVMLLIEAQSGRIVDANEAATRFYGYTREALLGMAIERINTLPQDSCRAERIRAVQGEANRFLFHHRLASGEVREVEVHATPLEEDGITYLLSSVLDVTKLHQAEEANRRILKAMENAQRLESLGRLAGGVAHDMNNVLAAILAYASSCLELEPPGSRHRKAFEVITSAAQRGADLMRPLLSLTRQTPAEEKPLDLNGILREEANLLERASPAGIRVQADLAPDLRAMMGDASALANAVVNLCVNALDAMQEQGILSLSTRNAEGGWIEVTVADTGPGMAPEVLERARDPFFTTKAEGKGTGLGLALVDNTAKAHRGQLEIASEPGRGTRATLRFPALPAALPLPAGLRPMSAAGAPGLEILHVDDDPLVRESIQAMLEVLGHRVRSVDSGEAALELVRSGCRPQVILLDLNMPGLGGEGALPGLREALPETPVLLCTGRATEKALALCRAWPGVALLSKPFAVRDLQAVLEPIGRLPAADG